VIGTAQELAALLPELKSQTSIAIDTEADSLHAYPEKLCLLQISLPERDVLVDPLAGVDMNPLLAELRDKELILHGADYDLRLLSRAYQFLPTLVFDTMWAARLLGYREFGLRYLVQQHLGVMLEKGPQKMNWALRPLSQRMITYASNDTKYLRPLAELLRMELKDKGRLEWAKEVFAKVIDDAARHRPPPVEDAWRIKGSDRLDPAAMAVLRELWRWREEEAIAANRPPYFILSHEKLVAIAATVARGRSARPIVPDHLAPKRRARLTAAIETGLQASPEDYPKPRRSTGIRLTKEQQRKFDQLKAIRDQSAAQLLLDPTVVASKSDLVSLVRNGNSEAKGLMQWQRQLLQVE